jgi:2'-phosphotransferase
MSTTTSSSTTNKNKRGGRRSRGGDSKDSMSRNLTYLLRHGAVKEKLSLRPDGYVPVKEIQERNKFKTLTIDQLKDIVDTCQKQRFKLTLLPVQNNKGEVTEEWFIRANQGHSIPVPDLELELIQSHADVPVCVHGTYYNAWDIIKEKGLSKMNRQHIHFAIGVPSDSHVISGMRSSSQILIYADVEKMVHNGIPLYKSSNDVLLCPGKLDTGIVPPEYFKRVIDVKDGTVLYSNESANNK